MKKPRTTKNLNIVLWKKWTSIKRSPLWFPQVTVIYRFDCTVKSFDLTQFLWITKILQFVGIVISWCNFCTLNIYIYNYMNCVFCVWFKILGIVVPWTTQESSPHRMSRWQEYSFLFPGSCISISFHSLEPKEPQSKLIL